MHVGYRGLGIVLVVVKYVCCATVCSKGSVHGKIKILDASKLPKDLIKMLLIDVFRKSLYYNLCALGGWGSTPISVVAIASPAAPATTAASTPAVTTAPTAAARSVTAITTLR